LIEVQAVTLETNTWIIKEYDSKNSWNMPLALFRGETWSMTLSDVDTYLDQFYRRFTPGTVHKSHIFSSNIDNGTKMKINVSMWELDKELAMEQDMIKVKKTEFGELTRKQAMEQWKPVLLGAPGIPDIKRCELFNKYRPLVPQPFRDAMCPKPPQGILDGQKKIRAEKAKAKLNAKKKKSKKKETTTADETHEDGKHEERGEDLYEQVVRLEAAQPVAAEVAAAPVANVAL
jgi:hypothetical protein